MNFDNDFKKVVPVIKKVCLEYSNNDIDYYNDLVQEAYIKFWKAYKKYDGKSKITSYAYRIAKNSCFDILRKKYYKRKIEFVNLDFEYDAIYNETDLDKEKLFTELMNRIENLNEEDKFIIKSVLRKETYQNIADKLNVTKNNIGVKVVRIKNKLKNPIT